MSGLDVWPSPVLQLAAMRALTFYSHRRVASHLLFNIHIPRVCSLPFSLSLSLSLSLVSVEGGDPRPSFAGIVHLFALSCHEERYNRYGKNSCGHARSSSFHANKSAAIPVVAPSNYRNPSRCFDVYVRATSPAQFRSRACTDLSTVTSIPYHLSAQKSGTVVRGGWPPFGTLRESRGGVQTGYNGMIHARTLATMHRQRSPAEYS